MAHKRKTWFYKLMMVLLTIPMLQTVGCFSDDDIRAIIGNVVTLTLDAAGVAINNLIGQNLLSAS